MKRRFLSLALIDVVFLTTLVTLGARYYGHIHPAGLVAIALALSVFCAAAGYALRLAYHGHPDRGEHVGFAANVCPAIGIAGVAMGFLLALSGGTENVQERVIGASSGLAATVVAVACYVVLDVQAHILKSGGRLRISGSVPLRAGSIGDVTWFRCGKD